MNIGEKIRNAREDMDLSQTKVAEMIPMNQSNYSKIERGIQEPSVTQLKSICEILKLDPRYLLETKNFDYLTTEELRLLKDIKKLIIKYNQKN